MPKRNPSGDRRNRSLVKSMTFRVLVVTSDTIITYTLTRRIDLTAGFVILTNLASTILYYSHERLWSHIKWGKN